MANATNKANARQSSRHKAKYQAYRNAGRREYNKARKILRHIKRHGLVPLLEDAPPQHLREALKKIPAHLLRDAARKSAFGWDLVKGWV